MHAKTYRSDILHDFTGKCRHNVVSRAPTKCYLLFYYGRPVIGQAIIFLPWGFFLLLLSFFFPHLISAAANWMPTTRPHMVWPQCEFRMHVWNVLQAARWKYRTQKIAILAPSHNFVGLYLRNWGIYRQSEKKLVKQQYLLHMSW